jgi:hypothetical protein
VIKALFSRADTARKCGPLGFVYNDNMKTRRLKRSIVSILVLMSLCIGGYLLYDRGRPVPVPLKQKLYEGVIYRRVVRVFPRPMIAHILTIDTKEKDQLSCHTAGCRGKPLKAYYVSVPEEFGLQIASMGINSCRGGQRGPADYYPMSVIRWRLSVSLPRTVKLLAG